MTSALHLKSSKPFPKEPYGSRYESIEVSKKFFSINKDSDRFREQL